MELNVDNLIINLIYYGILFAFFCGCPVILIINCVKVFKNPKYNKVDKLSSILNIFTITFYIPMSLFSVMQLIAHFDIQTKIQKVLWDIWCFIGLAIPVISIVSIVFSFTFRKERKSWLGLFIQFLPLVIFGVYITLAHLIQHIG